MEKRKQVLIRIPINLHEKLRYKSYLENKSINQIIIELTEEKLKDLKPPKR